MRCAARVLRTRYTKVRTASSLGSSLVPRPATPSRCRARAKRSAILDTYTKEHSAEYQAQALIDLARKLGGQIEDLSKIKRVVIHTSHHTHYVIGTVAGPHQFPAMVRSFQNVIGVEASEQIQDMVGRLPDAVCACVGGGSNAMGLFAAFLGDADVKIFGFEAGGEGVDSGRHAARFSGGRPGVLHG